MRSMYTGRVGGLQVSKSQCRAAVHTREAWGFTQCARKPVVFRAVEGHGECGFCRQHDPEAVNARREKSNREMRERWAAERAAADRAKREREALATCKRAIEQIAAGHNDPRSLAVEVLALFPSPAPLALREASR